MVRGDGPHFVNHCLSKLQGTLMDLLNPPICEQGCGKILPLFFNPHTSRMGEYGKILRHWRLPRVQLVLVRLWLKIMA